MALAISVTDIDWKKLSETSENFKARLMSQCPLLAIKKPATFAEDKRVKILCLVSTGFYAELCNFFFVST